MAEFFKTCTVVQLKFAQIDDTLIDGEEGACVIIFPNYVEVESEIEVESESEFPSRNTSLRTTQICVPNFHNWQK